MECMIDLGIKESIFIPVSLDVPYTSCIQASQQCMETVYQLSLWGEGGGGGGDYH